MSVVMTLLSVLRDMDIPYDDFKAILITAGWVALGVFVSLAVRRLWQEIGYRMSDDDRPGLVGYWIPFVGSALSIARGDGFWTNAESKYGPIFRAMTMGQEKMYITSAELINFVYKESKSFDFWFYRKHLQAQIYGMTPSHAQSESWDNYGFAAHAKGMQTASLGDTMDAYVNVLERELDEQLAIGEGEVDLLSWAYEIMYIASSKAFFSPSFPSQTSRPLFISFDRSFPVFLLDTLPNFLRKPAFKSRDKLLDFLTEWYSSTTEEDREAFAPAVKSMVEAAPREEWSDRDMAALILAELWALEANAPWAGTWALIEIIRRPDLLKTLQEEIATGIASVNPPTMTNLLHLPPSQLQSTLPKLNATLQETLRFHTSSFSIRRVQRDLTLPSTSAQSKPVALKQGDEVICVSRRCQVAKDTEWGDDADRWVADRFLRSEKKGHMMPFGGGVSMCEGRHFASVEILTFLAYILHKTEITITEDTAKHDMQRIGLGLIQPKGQLRVKLGSRAPEVKSET